MQGRWWGDYAARVEVLLHGLWHQDVGDLRLRLVHGNNSATLAAAGPDGYVMGSPRPRPFQPPPAKPWAMGRLRRTLQPFNLTQVTQNLQLTVCCRRCVMLMFMLMLMFEG